MLTKEDLKLAVTRQAVRLVPDGALIGVGSGGAVRAFLDELAGCGKSLRGVLASSENYMIHAKALGLPLAGDDLGQRLDAYVDSPSEINPALRLTKATAGALTREKILAAQARQFICVAAVDCGVPVLGAVAVPVEVAPQYRTHAAQQLALLPSTGARVHAELRMTLDGGHPFVTGDGNNILDTTELDLTDPAGTEGRINQIAGVITSGLFAVRRADVLVIPGPDGALVRQPS
ncbi:ribose-5-phosphate isomerase A [Longispora albida]|uniref:ribose-5-phosphate isomerase A n=1 Tax=Longispora albida TaxID=203523 RepID=UPI00036C2FFD|nr:ribose-5-phosphate isomerase A [Longispora albida]